MNRFCTRKLSQFIPEEKAREFNFSNFTELASVYMWFTPTLKNIGGSFTSMVIMGIITPRLAVELPISAKVDVEYKPLHNYLSNYLVYTAEYLRNEYETNQNVPFSPPLPPKEYRSVTFFIEDEDRFCFPISIKNKNPITDKPLLPHVSLSSKKSSATFSKIMLKRLECLEEKVRKCGACSKELERIEFKTLNRGKAIPFCSTACMESWEISG